ncbi:MAG: hypothetical protein OJI67_07875, partial [Prosthecobacter sp.]|nr:hypothetical protein [Prosthecobacter sp.]
DDATATDARDTLGLGTLATQSATLSDYLLVATAAATYQPLDADLTDLADGSLTGSKIGSGIDASNLTTGTVGTARLGTGTASSSTYLRGDGTWTTPAGAGTVTSVAVSGSDGIEIDSGSPVTSSGTIALGINASTLASHLGLAATYQPLDADLTDLADGILTGSKIGSGIDAGNITTGTVGTARLGSGTPSSSTYLRGDGTWTSPSGAGDVVGPASAFNGGLAAFDTSTGKLLQDSGYYVDAPGMYAPAGKGYIGDYFTAPNPFGSNTVAVSAAGIQTYTGSYYFTLKGSPDLSGNWTMELPINAGTSGQVLATNGSGVTSWIDLPEASPPSSADVVGPASATDNALARFDTTTGKLLQNSAATLDDSGALTLDTLYARNAVYVQFEGASTYLTSTAVSWNNGTNIFQLFQATSPTENWNLTFPPDNGTSGQVLTTDGTGVTSWSTVAGTGTVTSVALSGSDGIEIDSGSPVASSGTIALGINASTLASHLGLAATYQPLDADLTDIAGLAPTKGRLLVGDGSNWGDLNIGTDGQVLTAASAEDKGMIWTTPSGGGGSCVDVQTFTASGTWTKPAGAVSCRIIMVGGGGGGGSGRRGAADTDRSGGGG